MLAGQVADFNSAMQHCTTIRGTGRIEGNGENLRTGQLKKRLLIIKCSQKSGGGLRFAYMLAKLDVFLHPFFAGTAAKYCYNCFPFYSFRGENVYVCVQKLFLSSWSVSCYQGTSS